MLAPRCVASLLCKFALVLFQPMIEFTEDELDQFNCEHISLFQYGFSRLAKQCLLETNFSATLKLCSQWSNRWNITKGVPGTISTTNNISNKFGQRALKKQQNAYKLEDSLIIEVRNQSWSGYIGHYSPQFTHFAPCSEETPNSSWVHYLIAMPRDNFLHEKFARILNAKGLFLLRRHFSHGKCVSLMFPCRQFRRSENSALCLQDLRTEAAKTDNMPWINIAKRPIKQHACRKFGFMCLLLSPSWCRGWLTGAIASELRLHTLFQTTIPTNPDPYIYHKFIQLGWIQETSQFLMWG
jgi:hypothetical protein